MPGAMRKMGVYLGLVEDDDYGDVEGYGHAVERSPARREDYAEARYPREHGYGRHGEVAQVAHVSPREYGDEVDGYANGYEELPAYQITTLHPRTYNEARTIGEHFRKSTPVIMNLSEMDDADAKRLVDFAAGLTFGLHGRIERVTAKVFLLSPHNVTVTAQDKARIAETGFFNQS
ncbi:MAG: cell division inhibitor SepF [Pseudonocardiales bacterium]|jgi:cell division inhibitor SepF|nr:cell division inhibitor SepF [Pseudonocardiales bacterium]MDT4946755.1 cell division inhibitor SepF [Pseudonocardiales bacterium]